MQIINLEADISTPHLEVEMRTLRLGSGGTNDYPDLSNKPSINGTTLVGNILTADLGIKTSELTNDSGYITTADIPTKTSDLINDSDFTTGSALTAAIAAVSADIPTTTSQLTNDSGFLTSIDIPSLPTKTSDLVNDSGYITAAQAPVTTVNGLTGDVVITGDNAEYTAGSAITIHDKIVSLEATIPTATSDLTNDSGFITGSDLPTNVSDLNNDVGYITAAEAPVQSVNGQTGTVILKATDLAGGQAGYADISNAGQSVLLQDAANDTAVAYMTIEMSPIQAAGTPTPSDPLPITGLTDVVIVVTDSESNQTTTTIPLGQTVYGGELNVTTGELTITHGITTVNDAITNRTTSYTNPIFYGSINGLKPQTDNILCESFNVIAGKPSASSFANASNDGDFAINSANTGNDIQVFIRCDDYTDVTSLKNALGTSTIVYELATPITTTLTPADIKTYSTLCTISVDSNCDITYMRYFTEGSEFLVPQVKTILEAFNLL